MKDKTFFWLAGFLLLAAANLPGSEIHDAAKKGDLAKLRMLVSADARTIDSRDAYSLTPLHYAAINNRPEAVALLLEKGADASLRSADGKSALNFAEEKGHRDLAAWLRERSADRGPQKFPDLRGDYFGRPRPGDKPEVFAPGVFSTAEQDSPPELTADGREWIWSRNLGGTKYLGGMAILTSRLENGRWTAPRRVVLGDPKNNGYNPALSADGRRLIFCSNSRPAVDPARTPFPGTDVPTGDLWESSRTEEGWSEPVPLPAGLNSAGDDDCPVWAADGTLYFMSSRPGGPGPGNIYEARIAGKGFETPRLLPAPVNSTSGEYPTYVSPDRSYIIFTSLRPDGAGQMDLFVSFRSPDGAWGPAHNLGPDINSKSVDTFGKVTPDGKYFFFKSNKSGSWLVYWMDASFLARLKAKAEIR